MTGLVGEPGRLTATLAKQARYVDTAKCTGCGDCVKVCPVSLKDDFNQGLGERRAAYRLYPQAIPSAYAIQKLDRPPCMLTCPAHINVQGYIQLIKMGKYAEAVKLIMERAPLPGILGRVCPHPCEDQCRRQELDEPLAISGLKRFAADQVDLAEIAVPKAESRPEKVAIIGSGPAGLTCAYHLVLKGYKPTVFEALAMPGGMLRVGIPEYRLPRIVLDKEISNLLRLGVDIRCNAALGKDFSLDDLFIQGYQAVFLGIGCHVGHPLGIPGEEAEGVLQGVEFLRRLNLGQPLKVGKRVAVIGGGNVALDVACAARRHGAQVYIVYRRTREEMPAHAWEIDQGLCEGVRILYQLAPVKINTENGKITGLMCQQVHLGDPDDSGRRRPIPIAGSEFELVVDMVIPAIGQETSQAALQYAGVKISRLGTIEADEITYMTSRPGVFAAGDAHTGPWIAIEAIAGGIEAAESIDRYIRGVDMAAGRVRGIAARARWREIPKDEEGRPREIMPTLPPEITSICFAEIAQGYREDQARSEAERCVNCGVCSECMECLAVCQAGAIDHAQAPETVTLNVGSVILAPGFKPFDPSRLDTYGYGRYPNVLTSLEFERMLSPGGPYAGHVKRRSDGREPAKIAWVHCVGMRGEQEGTHPYCSSFCCMVGLKQAVSAREHLGASLDMALFFMDMRTPRKDFEKYMVRIKDQGARLIRSRVHSITQEGRSGDLRLRYVTEPGEVKDEIFDMAVLSVGGVITAEIIELSKKLGVRLSHSRFMDTQCFAPVSTSRKGVYSCGFYNGPKDIPQTVMEGSAAAAAAAQALAPARHSLVQEKVFPPEMDVAGEDPRVGVFICHCGLNIGGVADIPAIAEYIKTVPNVEYVQANLFSCSQDATSSMVEKIREHRLNRVVVAACTPATHQPVFQDMLRSSGLNKYLFEMANIRNQCTWVHQNEPAAATEKCKDLIRMAVAKTRLLEPLDYLTVPVNRKALVVGGGVSGMTAALNLAEQGFEVHLAERKDQLGGNALRLHTTWRGGLTMPRVDALRNRVMGHPRITVHFNAIVTGASGVVGNFKSKLSSGAEIHHGIVIIAIGAEPYRPYGEFLYGEHPDVLLSLDLDEEIAGDTQRLKRAKSIAFIQCVGSRTPERPYCNKVCCSHTVESALKLKEANPDLEVYVLYRDMRTYGEREIFYTAAREQGVIFIRYHRSDPPRVTKAPDGSLRITVSDHILQRPVTLDVDLLTLATAIIPHHNAPLAELYKVPLNAEGFFTEAHAKIRPVDAPTDGIYLAGLCHYPKPLQESVAEALATASRASTILSRDSLMLESTISLVIDEHCDGCAFCVDACPFQAISLMDYMQDGRVKKTVEVSETLCKGCGVCMATCPKRGIVVAGFTLEQLAAQVDAALEVA
jgi:heterodisulfide reductase subunit A-like polyferredoxin